MPTINRETREWGALGTRPAAGNEIYTPGEQPIASFDNWWNWAVSQDIEALDAIFGDHDARHEAGGDDELDLGGMVFDNTASLNGTAATGTLTLNDESDDSVVAEFDLDNDSIQTWPRFNTQARLGSGASVGANLVRQDNGNIVYNYTTGKVPWAEYADEAGVADHADTAGDSDLLDGLDSSAFLRPGVPATITSNWSFSNTVGADISGNAATADHADHADTADFAPESGNSDTVDGYHAQELIDAARSEGEWEFITEATHSNNSTQFDWDYTSPTTYDRYRLTVFHESHYQNPHKAFFWMKIGKDGVWDNRDIRYHWREADKVNDRWTEHNSHGWTVAGCWSDEFSISRYIISCPPSVNNPGKRYPTIAAVEDSAGRTLPRMLDHGSLTVNYSSINTFRLDCPFNTSTGKVILEGQNL